MKALRLVLALGGAAALLGVAGMADAFETQGAGDAIDGRSLLLSPQAVLPEGKGHSLALPLASKDTDGAPFVSSYGNAIAIPGPGIDQPAPAWALTPGAMRMQ
jgi:hypothetical protein